MIGSKLIPSLDQEMDLLGNDLERVALWLSEAQAPTWRPRTGTGIGLESEWILVQAHDYIQLGSVQLERFCGQAQLPGRLE